MKWFVLIIKAKYKLSVYDTIITVMFQWFWLLLRWQEGRKEAWFRLLLVSRKKNVGIFFFITSTYIYEKIFAGLKSLNLTSNQLYLKKLPEETNDKHQKKTKHSFLSTINIYDNLTYINFPFMMQLSRLCFSDSGYYYDDKKDAKKLDSGYY